MVGEQSSWERPPGLLIRPWCGRTSSDNEPSCEDRFVDAVAVTSGIRLEVNGDVAA